MRLSILVSVVLIGLLAIIFFIGLDTIGMIGFVYDTERTLTQEELAIVPQLSTEGYSQVVVNVTGSEINLLSGCRRLTMVTTKEQVFSIRRGMGGAMDYRPNAHDMVKNVIDVFEMQPLMVKINDLIGNAYFASFFVVQRNRILDLDSRPSDAIAIAVRSNIPVYVNISLMKEHGEEVC